MHTPLRVPGDRLDDLYEATYKTHILMPLIQDSPNKRFGLSRYWTQKRPMPNRKNLFLIRERFMQDGMDLFLIQERPMRNEGNLFLIQNRFMQNGMNLFLIQNRLMQNERDPFSIQKRPILLVR